MVCGLSGRSAFQVAPVAGIESLLCGRHCAAELVTVLGTAARFPRLPEWVSRCQDSWFCFSKKSRCTEHRPPWDHEIGTEFLGVGSEFTRSSLGVRTELLGVYSEFAWFPGVRAEFPGADPEFAWLRSECERSCPEYTRSPLALTGVRTERPGVYSEFAWCSLGARAELPGVGSEFAWFHSEW